MTFQMNHEFDHVSFQAWTESINIAYDVNSVKSKSYDIFGRQMNPGNNTLYLFLYNNLQYLTKRVFNQNQHCASLEWGCSRIHVEFDFGERFEIVNRQTSFVNCMIAIGSSLTIVKLIYHLI